MKKLYSSLLLLVLIVSLTPVAALTAGEILIVDDMQKISEGHLKELNDYALEISGAYQMDVAFFLVSNSYSPGQSLTEHVRDRYLEVQRLGPNGFVLAHNIDGELWNVISFGKAEQLITDDIEDRFWYAYDAEDTYVDGVRAYLEAAEKYLASLSPAADAAPSRPSELSFVADEALLLTNAQQQELNSRAEAISGKYQCEVRIITVENMRDYGYSDIEKFSYESYMDYNLGYGPDKNCVLFLLSTKDRDYDLRAWGTTAKGAFTFYAIDTVLDRHMLPLLKDDLYHQAFTMYLDKSEEYLQMAADGTPFDRDSDPVHQGNIFAVKMAVTILLPLLIAFIVCSVWKGQMKTAKIARVADNYIPAGGFRLTGQGDVFLYRTTTRTKIQQSSSSSSGSASSGRGGSSGRSGKY